MYLKQIKYIINKNFLCNYRQKQFLRQLISIIFFQIFILVINHYQGQNGNQFSPIPLYMNIAIVSYSRSIVLTWVGQKQTKQKQLQKIMGVGSGAYLSAWILYFLINGIYISLVFIIPLKLFGYFDSYSSQAFIHVLVLYLLYMLSSFFFILFLCSFFSKAKIAAQAISFIQLITSFLFFLTFDQKFSSMPQIINLTSLLPPLAYDYGLFSTGVVSSVFPITYTFQKAIFFLLFDTILYLILFLYFDQVLPNEYGTNRHPLFFIRWLWVKKCDQVKQKQSQLLINSQEEIRSSKYYMNYSPSAPSTVQMIKVTKQFGTLKAVDQVTLTLYQEEIFCLLGHNGAGKSTTINLLTGMLKKDHGAIFLKGLNYSDNIDQIRKMIGLCLQQDVLYDMLNVEQHITYYARMKGLNENQIIQQVKQTIQKCALTNQTGKLAKNLSGGNRRKLSLANALVGKSKIIFLDEPTSGLDPNSRQAIWQILQQIKNQKRTIVLTTHHLQQAEKLAKRIGIMVKGKLLILGDNNFIKMKFGVGYHLFITFNESNIDKKETCKQILKREGVRRDEQSSGNVLKYILPFSKQPHFVQLFKQIQSLGVQCSLKISSLEDAFVNIGIHQDLLENVRSQLPELPNIPRPVNISCKYSFKSQFSAVFSRKALSTFKSFSSVGSIVLPVGFILIGVFVSAFTIEGNSIIQIYVKFFILQYFIIWGFVFTTSAYCGGIVQQRQKKFKYLSNVMGLRKIPYWTACFVFDICIFLIPLALFYITVFCIGEKAHFILERLQWISPAFLLFSLSFISYSYAFSFVFQKAVTAYRFFPFLNFIFFYILPSIPNYVIPDSNFTKYVIPFYSPFITLSNIFQSPEMVGQDMQFLYNTASIKYLMMVLFVQFVFFMSLTLFLQSIRFSLKENITLHNQDQVNSSELQEAVRIQDQRVHQLRQVQPIVIDSLYKKYGNGYLAIRNNTFMVEKGQMFGLLGPNGAGKSTTFNILTAAIPKTSGKVKLNGVQINKGIMEIFQDVGICPQFDSLYDNLTVRQHLIYFARIKGQINQKIQELVKYYLQVMQLTEYADIQAGKLSGGNKRKLCVSMAMIGNPQLMFFDQPSSGVDPIARRFLWQTLNSSLKNTKSSIVLTTHSMTQAESMCHRIGILIKGKFVCIGTPLQLKKKYGNGYKITLKLKDKNKLHILRNVIKQNYSNYTQFIDQENMLVAYQIPPIGFKFFKAFQIFQKQCENHLIDSFQIAEASLEQIFLFFSKMQPVEVDNIIRKEPWEVCCFEWGSEGCLLRL